MKIKQASGYLSSIPKKLYEKVENVSKIAICTALLSNANAIMANEEINQSTIFNKDNVEAPEMITANYAGKSFELNREDVTKLVKAKNEYNENMDVLEAYLTVNNISEDKFLTSLDQGLRLKDIKREMGNYYREISGQRNTPLDQYAGKNDFLFEEEVEKVSNSYMNSIGRNNIPMNEIFNKTPNHFKQSVINEMNKNIKGTLHGLQLPEHFVHVVDSRLSNRGLINLERALSHGHDFNININGVPKTVVKNKKGIKNKI